MSDSLVQNVWLEGWSRGFLFRKFLEHEQQSTVNNIQVLLIIFFTDITFFLEFNIKSGIEYTHLRIIKSSSAVRSVHCPFGVGGRIFRKSEQVVTGQIDAKAL